MKKIYSMLALVAFVGFSCENKAYETSVAPNYSGEELFRGIFLLSGDVTDKIDVFSTLKNKYDIQESEESKAIIERLGTDLTTAINQKDQAFFPWFKKEVESGDHLRISDALTTASEKFANAVMLLPATSGFYKEGIEMAKEIDLSSVVDEQGNVDEARLDALLKKYAESKNGRAQACSIGIACVFYLAAAVHFNVAVTINAAVAINAAIALQIWRWAGHWSAIPRQSTSETNPLLFQMLVNDIAVNFKK